ncbi:MAG: hypothetical protein V1926_03205, partial [Candidatus Peregrinibacteria bacterium]
MSGGHHRLTTLSHPCGAATGQSLGQLQLFSYSSHVTFPFPQARQRKNPGMVSQDPAPSPGIATGAATSVAQHSSPALPISPISPSVRQGSVAPAEDEEASSELSEEELEEKSSELELSALSLEEASEETSEDADEDITGQSLG